MIKTKIFLILTLVILFISGGVLAQFGGRGGGRGGQFGGGGRGGRSSQFGGRGGGRAMPNQQFLDAREREGLFQWEINQEFSDDVFTFVRIVYNSGYGGLGSGRSRFGRGGGFGGGGFGGRSGTDWPDSDNNFSFRLQQLTSIEVNPEPVLLELTNPELPNYPFIYIVEPGSLSLRNDEVKALRSYLLNGGFLMLDDFWGISEWYNVYTQMKKVFPEKEPVLLTLEHPIFHCVFELKELPQIPAIDWAVNRGSDTLTGRTSESGDPPNYYAIYDDKGRIMVIICRDTDLGDGWEREGESRTYFREFSEKKAYPLGINIVFYAMTH